MKNLVLAYSFILLLMGCACAQVNEVDRKLDKKEGKEIVLLKVLSDSRCPEGVQCIWAGEVTIELAAYNNNKMIEQVQFVVNRHTAEEIVAWFEKHLPERKEKLKRVNVVPYPKEGVQLKQEDYKITLD